jgi:hypothetical protein
MGVGLRRRVVRTNSFGSYLFTFYENSDYGSWSKFPTVLPSIGIDISINTITTTSLSLALSLVVGCFTLSTGNVVPIVAEISFQMFFDRPVSHVILEERVAFLNLQK